MVKNPFAHYFILLNILIFYLPVLSYSQNNFNDSTEDSISKYLYNDPLKAKKFTYSFLEQSERNSEHIKISKSYNYLGIIYQVLSLPDSSYLYFDKAIEKAQSINDKKLIIDAKIYKAGTMYLNFDFENALETYEQALELIKEVKDIGPEITIKTNIAQIKYQMGKYSEVKSILRGLFNEKLLPGGEAIINLHMAGSHLKLNEIDSSLTYLKKGLDYCLQYNDKELEVYFLNEYANYFVEKNQLKKADSVIYSAVKIAKDIKSPKTESMALLTLAKLNHSKDNIKESIGVLKEILRKQNQITFTPEELSSYYKLLAENYKKIDSIELSNIYYQKYVEEENKKQRKKFNTIEELHELDLKRVENEKLSYFKQKKVLTSFLVIAILVFFAYYFFNRRKQKNIQEKFNSLIEKVELYEKSQKELKSNKVTASLSIHNDLSKVEDIDVDNKDAPFIIKDEKVTEILEKLEKLEKKKYYLRQDFTLPKIAKRLKTNTAYLSKVINNELGKSFSNYTNDLRINYAIIELKKNEKLRAYSVNSIAQEIGYKRAEPFTKYFRIATGITPATYIKKINNLNKKKTA